MRSNRGIPLLLAGLVALCAAPARADVEDLSTGKRPGDRGPAAARFILRAHLGTDYAPFGRYGAALSYLNDWSLVELELGAGTDASFSGVQGGFSVRKLFGVDNDFLVVDLTIGWAGTTKRAADPLVPGSPGHNVWTNLGMGFEHRTYVSITVTGGLTLLGFSEAPTAFVHGGVGFGF